MATLPNLITLARLCAVPLIVLLLIEDRMGLAFWVFVAAGVSDAVDGAIARRFKLISTIGTYLDPVADKALLISIYVTLGVLGNLPRWLVVVVISRDVAIVGAVILSVVLAKPLEMRPLYVSKATTTAQIVLAAVVLADLEFASVEWLEDILVYATAALTVASAAAYLVAWVRHMSDGPDVPPPGGGGEGGP